MTVKRVTFEAPHSCRWCGTERRNHGRRWAAIIGMHSWLEPSQEMVLERMRRRRAARQTAIPPLFHATTGWAPDHTGESAEPYCADCGRESCPRWTRIQTRLDQIRFGLPRRTRRTRKTAGAGAGWGGESWPF